MPDTTPRLPTPERRQRPRVAVAAVSRAGQALRALGLAATVASGLVVASVGLRVTPTAQASTGPLPGGRSVAPPIEHRAEPRREPSILTPGLRAKGFNACYAPDPGFGRWLPWKSLVQGQILLPAHGGATADAGYDVVVHFHGHEAVRHGFIEAARGSVLVGIDLGIGSGPYESAFRDRNAWPQLVASIERALQKHAGTGGAHIRHLALSSWSAGYGAVTQILAHHAAEIDAVVLLDSLHSDYVTGAPQDLRAIHGVWGLPIAPVTAFAQRAARGDGVFYFSHSQVVPPGYASTTEVADFVLGEVGGARVPMQAMNPLGAELQTGFDVGGVRVRGYAGADERAHCAHVAQLAEVVRDQLEPAWGTPEATE